MIELTKMCVRLERRLAEPEMGGVPDVAKKAKPSLPKSKGAAKQSSSGKPKKPKGQAKS